MGGTLVSEQRKARARLASARYKRRRLTEIDAMPKIPCACGCGTLIAPINRTLKPARFAHGHNRVGKQSQFRARQNMGPLNARWRGGKMTKNGYIRLLVDEHHP